MKKRLSVIIPMYNAKAYIKRCIDSILNQGFEGLEIIAVDDGSTDATCSVIQGYADERIRLVRQEKRACPRPGTQDWILHRAPTLCLRMRMITC